MYIQELNTFSNTIKIMKKSNYQIAKAQLKEMSDEAKQVYKNDKPAIRQSINDYADCFSRENNLNDHQRNLLANYASTLHPKD